jgi:ketosteroid isomerase-like protein
MRCLLILLLAASSAFAASPEQAIRSVLSDQVQDWNRGNIDAFMKGYEDSPNTLFLGKAIQRGYEQVRRRYHNQYPTAEKMGQLKFSDLSVALLGDDYASVTGTFQLTRSATAGGNASGIFSLLFRRTLSGWKIILDHTS